MSSTSVIAQIFTSLTERANWGWKNLWILSIVLPSDSVSGCGGGAPPESINFANFFS